MSADGTTHHVLQGLLLLVMSLHTASLARSHVMLQLVQGLELLSTRITQFLDKVIACLHKNPTKLVMLRERPLLRHDLATQGACHLGQKGARCSRESN